MSTTTEVPHMPGTPSATCPPGFTPDYRFFCRPVTSTNAEPSFTCPSGYYPSWHGYSYCESSTGSGPVPTTMSVTTAAPTATASSDSWAINTSSCNSRMYLFESDWPGCGSSASSGVVATSVASGSGTVTGSGGGSGGTVIVTPTGTAASTGLGVRHAELDAGVSALVSLVLGALMLVRMVV